MYKIEYWAIDEAEVYHNVLTLSKLSEMEATTLMAKIIQEGEASLGINICVEMMRGPRMLKRHRFKGTLLK